MAPDVLNSIMRRAESTGLSQTMVDLLVALMVLLIVAILLVGTLLILRQRRKSLRSRSSPHYDASLRHSTCSMQSFHRRTSARPSQSIHVFREKQLFEQSSESEPSSKALPEIRITFPEEIDPEGKRQSGHVVVVRVGDSGFGLEPLADDLPAYQQDAGGRRFQSIDLERVGGLEEKDTRSPHGWS